MMSVQRPGRALAIIGAMVAVGATTLMALATGTAVADEPGRCVENVNVRAEPSVDSEIVALCEAGTEIQVGESRDGFLYLTDLGGWSAQEYISVNGASPAAPTRSGTSSTEPEPSAEPEPSTAAPTTSPTTSRPAPTFRAPDRDAAPPATSSAQAPAPEPETDDSLLDGLLP